jgi:hypothetical protein
MLLAGGLTAVAASSPAALASGNPTISASGGYDSVQVTGTNFTPKGTVLVQVYDQNYHFVNSTLTTAAGPHTVCHTIKTWPYVACQSDPGGEISTGLNSSADAQYNHVVAYDYGSHRSSNWATALVYKLP